jgi:hypothetical protein
MEAQIQVRSRDRRLITSLALAAALASGIGAGYLLGTANLPARSVTGTPAQIGAQPTAAPVPLDTTLEGDIRCWVDGLPDRQRPRSCRSTPTEEISP